MGGEGGDSDNAVQGGGMGIEIMVLNSLPLLLLMSHKAAKESSTEIKISDLKMCVITS